ncbi:sodium-dependent transporter [Lachnospiraceae bacterium 45-P1]
MKERSSFTSRIGFVLAAAGSAVGLGNMWRFPYLAAKYGGGAFLIIYILLALTFGFTLMITEIALGRRTRLSCIEAFKSLDRRFAALGWLSALIPVIITPYYCVIGGWVMKYLAEFAAGNGLAASDDAFFGNFIGSAGTGVMGRPMFWFLVFVLITAIVVLFGVEKGVEKASRVMMPVLVLLSIGISVYSLTLPGAMGGLKYYLLPDFSDVSVTTILAAMGQLFYSMSLAMGIMITYGSYMKKEDKLEKSVAQIEIFDTGIAFLAGLMIIPAVVAFNGGDASLIRGKAGPGLMFGVLPKVFESMNMGGFIGGMFFLLVLFAALTSSISLLETVVSIVSDRAKINRRSATIISTAVIILLGIPSCLGYGPWAHITILKMQFLDFFDFVSNSVLMPIAAIGTCVFVGHVLGCRYVEDEVESSGEFKRKKLYRVMIRWVAPVMLAAILAGELLKYFGIISI